ncbi:MAG: CYTH domain-containing protein [Leucobacter sp.]
MSNEAVETFEIERKYEVAAAAQLPTARAFEEAGFDSVASAHHALTATYFDTHDRVLARNRLALRTRSGGKDDGWHLKVKGDGGLRELLWPVSAEIPEAVLAAVRDRVGDAADRLVPMAELSTARAVVLLRARDGRGEVEIADDAVRACDLSEGVRRAWREWEAELGEGADPALLDALEPVLLAAGATHSLSFAKAARAGGQLLNIARAAGADAERIAALERLDASDREAARRLEA